MAFSALAQLAVSSVVGRFKLTGAVCELGNQRFKSDNQVSRRCSELVGKILSADYSSTKDFYKDIGLKRYIAIDLNSELDAIPMNLNKILRYEYSFQEEFDLVTNNGTGEHIFNQAAVFENCHNLCKPGGVMLHLLPLSPFLNHGFYNFNPILFRDIANANRYEINTLWLASQRGELFFNFLAKNVEDAFFEQKRPYNPPSLLEAAISRLMIQQGRISRNVMLVCGLSKRYSDNFVYPIQGRYVDDVRSSEIAAGISTTNLDTRQSNHEYDYLKKDHN